MLYFDHCASTPPYDEVVQTMMEVMKSVYANPSSLHRAGADADKLIERSRSVFAERLQATHGNWLFTSGGTESNNLAIKGVARQYAGRGKHLITTQIEHASVYESFAQLEQEGFRVTYLPVSKTGHVRIEQLEDALTEETILVSIMHVNNEIGTIQPIEQIGRLLQRFPKVIFHVDAVQSISKLPIQIKDWGIDLLSGSSHKLRGPKGVGFLFVREGVSLYPMLTGGTQENGFRAGTQNVPAIVASAKALRMSMESMAQRESKMMRLKQMLVKLIGEIPELKLNGAEPAASHIIHFSYPGMKPEVVIHMLEQHGIMASTKSACSSKDDKPSRVLLAIGASHEQAAGGVRISLGDEHEERDISALAAGLRHVVEQLKPLERRLI
ncbi:cysteine desulfurase family protein [Paenibacillus sp. LHD-38]|uniref:cysteine desulfurase family protein n=1 Tax=Paenibacillus sp. LHD-38 TaxID=3072143 RepID=UPI00280D77EE|nr:cysteine desulfurase family protein [Paenibacillus sp. LHD-38]MDQ8736827.1 cysteine desulfurase family protein [Paenibacillus sp. LHD-38]